MSYCSLLTPGTIIKKRGIQKKITTRGPKKDIHTVMYNVKLFKYNNMLNTELHLELQHISDVEASEDTDLETIRKLLEPPSQNTVHFLSRTFLRVVWGSRQ
jgi:hypothetical protein